jgi:hypothetical protein
MQRRTRLGSIANVETNEAGREQEISHHLNREESSRIEQFIESGVLDAGQLDQILTRHGLLAKWESFMHRYRQESE